MERISPIAPLLPLSSYYLARWCCCSHGYFESGTEDSARVACPECGEDAGLVDQCRGLTHRELPFISRPRLDAAPDNAKWQITDARGVTGRARANPQSYRRGKGNNLGRAAEVSKGGFTLINRVAGVD
jgi:hypothetical protein